jgi:hypothetical protein
MDRASMSRRRLGTIAFSALAALASRASHSRGSSPRGARDARPDPAADFDFDTQGVDDWTVVAGQWGVEQLPGAASGTKALVQHATKNDFNVIVAPPGPYTDAEVSDASGGIVFRFHDGRYYVVRANALEENFRLYAYDQRRRQLATATVKKPPLGQWHRLRVVAIGDRVQASLNGILLLDHRDARFKAGRVGLWTKADAITAFDDLTIRGIDGPRALTGEGNHEVDHP